MIMVKTIAKPAKKKKAKGKTAKDKKETSEQCDKDNEDEGSTRDQHTKREEVKTDDSEDEQEILIDDKESEDDIKLTKITFDDVKDRLGRASVNDKTLRLYFNAYNTFVETNPSLPCANLGEAESDHLYDSYSAP